jgi:hypothetical protein
LAIPALQCGQRRFRIAKRSSTQKACAAVDEAEGSPINQSLLGNLVISAGAPVERIATSRSRFVGICTALSKERDERRAPDCCVPAGKGERAGILIDFERRDTVAALVAYIQEISTRTELEIPGVVSHGRYLLDAPGRAIGSN